MSHECNAMGNCKYAQHIWIARAFTWIQTGHLRCVQVFAPTFPGYGRAEKPALAYSQELWRDFLRDFVIEVSHDQCWNTFWTYSTI